MLLENSGSIRDSLNLFSWPEDTSVSSANDKLTPLVKNLPFTEA